MASPNRPIRVVQWATGNIGNRSLREVIRDPRMELVGLRVYDPAKVGRDAGSLCGEPDVAVTATDDPAAIYALEADCVLYMPNTFVVDEVVTLLAAGKNVVTTRGEAFADAQALPAEDRARILDACARGSSSIFATGSSPGFISEAVPAALLSLQRRVDLVEINEYANMSTRDSPQMIFEHMGYGQPIETATPRNADYMIREFGPSLGVLAQMAGHRVDSWSARGEMAATRTATTIAAGDVGAGTVGAHRLVVSGSSGGQEIVRFTANWYLTPDLDPAWEVRDTGWRVQVHGDTSLDVGIAFPVTLDQMADYTPGLTAHRPVNAVPFVCAARPGILGIADLPPLTPGTVTFD